MTNLLSFHYWLNNYPAAMQGISLTLYILFLVTLFLGALLSWFYKKKKGALYYKILHNFFALFLSNFLIGSIYLFLVQETIPVLSARYWFLLWMIITATWLYFIVKKTKKIPQIKKEREKIKEYQKYIP